MNTIVDVAREAGVSIATVSRVINQPDLVRKETLDKVHGAMSKLNYNQNRLAHSLRSGNPKSVALLVGDIASPFFGSLARSLSRQGESRGYELVLYDLDNSVEKLISILSRLQRSDTGYVVIALSTQLNRPEIVDALTKVQMRGIKVITNSQIVNDSIGAVLPHFDGIVSDGVDYLLDQGANQLVFMGGLADSTMTIIGEEGFAQACEKHKLDTSQSIRLQGQFQVETTRMVLREFLADHSRDQPDKRKIGVICQTTRMAMGAVLAALDAGFKIPQDISILCCEEIPQASEWSPQLTTLSVAIDELGTAVFDSFLQAEDNAHIYLPHHLIERGST